MSASRIPTYVNSASRRARSDIRNKGVCGIRGESHIGAYLGVRVVGLIPRLPFGAEYKECNEGAYKTKTNDASDNTSNNCGNIGGRVTLASTGSRI